MRGVIAWFVHNPIAANLLMVLILFGGLTGVPALDKKYIPDFQLDLVTVTLPYPGAGPREVEEQICIRIEEAVHDLNGVKEIRSTARQGSGVVVIEAESGYDMGRLAADIKTRVDSITTFPAEAERPVVAQLAHRHEMMAITVAGDIGEENLKLLGESLRDDLATQPNVSLVELLTPRPYEVSVEVSELTLRRYGLRFEDVVQAIRGSSLNLPAGSIKSRSGDIQVQTRGQAYAQADFEDIVIVSKRDGTRILLGDVATVLDGFADVDVRNRFNDKPSLDLEVYVTSSPDVLRTDHSVNKWLDEVRGRLPDGVELVVWRNQTEPFKYRVETLLANGLGGLALVFLVLLIFLRPLLALWVCIGIAVAFLGCLWLLQYTGVSLNMVSLFAFILILGIVVDDAIIVGESIHAHQHRGDGGDVGAIRGASGVMKPVLFAVISTMIFFVPMYFFPGDMSTLAADIPTVVILALTFSLIECLLILPAHLAHMRPLTPVSHGPLARLEQLRERCADSLPAFAGSVYRPFLQRCLNANMLTLSLFFMCLLLSLAVYAGGWMKAGFFPTMTSDWVYGKVEMEEGGPFEETVAVMDQVEAAAIRLREKLNSDAEARSSDYVIGNISARSDDEKIRVFLEVNNVGVDAAEVAELWRGEIGELPPVKDFRLDYSFNDVGKPIVLVVSSDELSTLERAAELLQTELESYDGVFNVTNDLQSPRQEIELDLKPAAENLGITLADLALQVRRAFYGAEAQRIPRAREDVKVMVRYPERERLATENLREMRIRTPDGREVPFDVVAEVRYVPGYQTIERLQRKRTMQVSAEVVPGTSVPREVVDAVLRESVPEWQVLYPDLTIVLDGELQEEQDFTVAFGKYMLMAMLIIYGLMAIPFRSYWQPFLILTAVPFGIMGAIIGHFLLDERVSMMSLLGVLACSGVVVNDNLVLIDRINQLRATGHSVRESLLQGAQDRFRPIILTSVTTFIGLVPMMLEDSPQAAFLQPMIISLAFGVLLATGVTLVLVPSLYLFGDTVQRWTAELLSRPKLATTPDEVQSPDR